VIESIDQFQANPDLKDPSVNWEDFIPGPTEYVTTYGDARICFPNWNYNYIYWVRKDFLENPDEQASFQEEYGYELALPETMEQLADIAEFFTRDAGDTLAGETLSEPMYGFVQEGARLGTPFQGVYWAFMRQFGGGLFDEEGRPNVDTPENVEALQAYYDLWQYAPPGASEFSLIDIPVVMGEGRAASGFGWSDFFFSVDKEGGSPLAGNFAYAPIPMVGDGANRVTPVSLGCEVMSKASENKEATFLFMQWMASKLTQDAWFELDQGAMPVRTDTFEHPKFSGGQYASLYEAVQPTLEEGQSWTQIPELFEISDAINLEQQRLINGEQSAQETATALQSAMEEICGDGCFAEQAKPIP
jgi:multiple sugar transport system substrate-binding protein